MNLYGAASGGGRWTEARWLRLGDHFLTRTGKSATVTGLIIRTERVKVYNLHVEGLHVYAVGEHGLLVHNSRAGISNQPHNRLVSIGKRHPKTGNELRRWVRMSEQDELHYQLAQAKHYDRLLREGVTDLFGEMIRFRRRWMEAFYKRRRY